MLMRICLLAVLCVSVVAMSCSQVPITTEKPTSKAEPTPKEEPIAKGMGLLEKWEAEKKQFREGITDLMAKMEAVKNATLYEGLPHQHSEGDLLAKELKEKQTITLHQFAFYKEPIAMPEEVERKLRNLCLDSTQFEHINRWEMKFCCEFHPDWCLEFRETENVYHIQICFGCNEATIFGPNGMLHGKINETAAIKLDRLLKPLQKNRPRKPEKE